MEPTHFVTAERDRFDRSKKEWFLNVVSIALNTLALSLTNPENEYEEVPLSVMDVIFTSGLGVSLQTYAE